MLQYNGIQIFSGTCNSIKAAWNEATSNNTPNVLKRIGIVFKAALAGLIACISFLTVIPFAFPSIFNETWRYLNGYKEPDSIILDTNILPTEN